MTDRSAAVKDEIRQFVPFDGHQGHPVDDRFRGEYPFCPGFHANCIPLTDAAAYAATEAEILARRAVRNGPAEPEPVLMFVSGQAHPRPKGTVPFSPTTASPRCPRKSGQSPEPLSLSFECDGGESLFLWPTSIASIGQASAHRPQPLHLWESTCMIQADVVMALWMSPTFTARNISQQQPQQLQRYDTGAAARFRRFAPVPTLC